MTSSDVPLWAVVLAGGIGSRFWPVSTPGRPKQLLPLAGDRPLVRDTIDRITPLVGHERLRILTGERLADPILSVAPELDRDNLVIEPQARGTAPVLTWAAFQIARREPDAVMVSLHADHVIQPGDAFRSLIAEIARLTVERDMLFTIGIQPTRPDTGYGYIRVGDRLGPALDAYRVGDFIEKPDVDTAHEYLHRGGYLWNSGIFIWRAATLLSELKRHTPELASLLPLLEEGDVDAFFERAPQMSIDEGLLERSDRVAVGRATFQWDDIGTWDSVGRTHAADEAGNVGVGDVRALDSESCIAWADDGTIVLFGVRDTVVVRSGDITLVLPRERSAELKDLLEQLPEDLRRPQS